MEQFQEKIKGFWPDWEIVEKIGEGSFGVVYKAVRHDLAGTTYAAIKAICIPKDEDEIEELQAEGLSLDQTYSYFKQVVKDYTHEIKLMDSVKGNTNIVSIEDYKIVESDDQKLWYIFIRMELLTPLMKKAAIDRITEPDIIRAGIDLCTALEICRKKNIVHRDIKPQNIFVSESGDYKLGDFGVARSLSRSATSLSRKGAPNYMAPELYKTSLREIDIDDAAKVDIYSLGLVLFWMGNDSKLPFVPTDKQIATPDDREKAFIRRISGETLPGPTRVSPELQRIILKACAFNPEDRYTSAGEMKQDLLRLRDGEPLKTEKKDEKPPKPRKPYWLYILLAVVVLAGAAVLWKTIPGRTGGQTDTGYGEAGVTDDVISAESAEETAPETVSEPVQATVSEPVPETVPESVEWSVSDGVLRISGSGEMEDYSDSNKAPWYSVRDSVTTLVVDEGITSIGMCAFSDFIGLTEVRLPDSLRKINASAFAYCDHLTTLIIPEGVETIGTNIISHDTGLQGIRLPSTLKRIEGYFGGNCPELETITLAVGNQWYCVRDGVLFDADVQKLICHPAGLDDTSYRIPDTVKTVEGYAFSDNNNLVEIIIPDSVTAIDLCAFIRCVNLRSVTFPDSVSFIEQYAFYGCEKLKSVSLPSRVTKLNQQVFGNCTSLEEVVIPSTVTSIGRGTFGGSPNVVIYGETGSYAETYAGETGIPFRSLTPTPVPDSVEWSFSDGVLGISGSGDMDDYSYPNEPPWNSVREYVTTLVVDEGITSIGKRAFFDFDGLAEVRLPGSLRRINEDAFAYCDCLTRLIIPEGVESIGKSIIYRNPGLQEIQLPSTLKLIEGSFAGECPVLKTISLAEDNQWYCVKDGVLFDSGMQELICHPAGLNDTSYSIPDTVLSLGVYAFAENNKLVEIIIPDSVTAIHACAFTGCGNLRSATVPDSVSLIEHYAFYGCEKLNSIRLPSRITNLDQQAFYGCSSLKSIEIPESVVSITGSSVFGNCISLEKVIIPSSVTGISGGTFDGSPNVVIYGETGSYAEAFAGEAGIPFASLTPAPELTPEPEPEPTPTPTPEPTPEAMPSGVTSICLSGSSWVVGDNSGNTTVYEEIPQEYKAYLQRYNFPDFVLRDVSAQCEQYHGTPVGFLGLVGEKGINLRTGPNIGDSYKGTQLHAGTKVYVYFSFIDGTNRGWYYATTANGQNGFLRTDFLELIPYRE